MRSRILGIVSLALVFGLGACRKEENNGPGVKTNNSVNNGQPDADVDMGGGEDVSTNNGVVDLGNPDDTGLDFNVAAPGFMHGTWQVERRSDNAKIATLQLRHVEGETGVKGTYAMDEPAATGPLAGGTYVTQTFSTSWTVNVEDSNEQLGLADCNTSNNDTLECRHSSTLAGNVIDALLIRQP